MRIGIFDPYLDTLGGGEKYMLTTASCLSKKHQVFVFWEKEKEIRERVEQRFHLNLSRVKFTKNIFSRKTSFFFRLWESRKYDLIIYLSDGSFPFVFCPLVVHFQFPVEGVKQSFKNRIKLSRVKKVICNSYFTKFFIDKKFKIKSVVLYPPVELVTEETAGTKETKGTRGNVILHVGRLGIDKEGVNFKKQDVMIETFKKISGSLKDWRFVLAIALKKGDEKKFLKLKKRVKGYPIEIIENPSYDHLWELYKKAKIYWHATGFGEDLDKHPERAEHFGMSTVEAMSAGCVPVVINAGGQREIIKDGEDGLLWETLKELEDKTLWVIEDQSRWQRLSESAKRTSLSYSKERFCQELNEII